MRINGVVFYEGPSTIDGSPIVAIATFKSANKKTGDMIQTWIIRADAHPVEAIHKGLDASICGDCPLRGLIAKIGRKSRNAYRACYVRVQQAPAAVYRAYKRGSYPTLNDSHRGCFANKALRFGSYGDPVAVPVENWDYLTSFATNKKRPGYTHQWKDSAFAGWSNRIMASVHTTEEKQQANDAGWRTFRTVASVDDLAKDEILCPASEEGGFTRNCLECGACNGSRGPSDRRHNVAIVGHGTAGKAQRVFEISTSK
jgi:hypothetical protein